MSDQEFEQKKKYEIIIHGRGGQGAKTTAELLAQAGLKAGLFVQAFPEFGPERSGAPLRTFVRLSHDFIRSHEPIVSPEAVLILDDTLLNSKKVLNNLDQAQLIVVNSHRSAEEIENKLKERENFRQGFQGKIKAIDASGISQKIIGQDRPNTVILGYFAALSQVVSVTDIEAAFQEKYLPKIGKELVKKNVQAIGQAYLQARSQF